MAKALPLEGIRVANFGWGWLGPVFGQTLSFLGAEVYKIESRARVDINRQLPPFAEGIRDPDRSLQNHACWAGNGSITLNLKKPEAQELARELVAKCDVAGENFGPGVMNKFNLGYEDLRKVNEKIILVSMPAAGLNGPLKDVRTYGMSLSSLAGLDSTNGYADGVPVPFENAFADPLGGVIGALGAILALHNRERTGRGQHVDYSQQEGVMQMMGPHFMDYFMNGRVARTISNKHPLRAAAPHGVFPCKGNDRWISIAVMNEDEWMRLVQAMGSPLWSVAGEFNSHAERVRNIDSLHQKLAAWTADYDDYELANLLQRYGVAAAPVTNIADLLNDPHYKARGTFIEVQHPLGFKEMIYGSYVKMSCTEARVKPGPYIGQDNVHVFKDLLALSDDRYRRLVDEQVIF